MGDYFIIRKFTDDVFIIFRIKKCPGPDTAQYKLSISQGESPKDEENDIYLGTYLTKEEASKAIDEYQLIQ